MADDLNGRVRIGQEVARDGPQVALQIGAYGVAVGGKKNVVRHRHDQAVTRVGDIDVGIVQIATQVCFLAVQNIACNCADARANRCATHGATHFVVCRNGSDSAAEDRTDGRALTCVVAFNARVLRICTGAERQCCASGQCQ